MARGRFARRIVLGITFLAGLARAPAVSAQVPGDDAEALIRRGTELRHEGQDAQALPYFESAYRLSRNPRAAAQLGLVKMALGYCVDAERLLTEALAVPDHPWIERNHATLEKTRASARKNIGEITVTGTPAGADVVVNGRSVGHLPLQAPLRLDKGPVELQIRAPAYATFARSFTIGGGEHEVVAAALAPLGAAWAPAAQPVPMPAAALTSLTPPPAPPPSAPPLSPPPRPSASPPALAAVPAPVVAPHSDARPDRSAEPVAWMKPAFWIAAAGAAAGLGLGIVETVVASNRTDDFNNHTSPTSEDPSRQVPDCETSHLTDACRSIRDARDRARTLAIVGYVGAGVLGAASAALFVLSARQGAADPGQGARAPGPPAAVACAPALAMPGLSCLLRF